METKLTIFNIHNYFVMIPNCVLNIYFSDKNCGYYIQIL